MRYPTRGAQARAAWRADPLARPLEWHIEQAINAALREAFAPMDAHAAQLPDPASEYARGWLEATRTARALLEGEAA